MRSWVVLLACVAAACTRASSAFEVRPDDPRIHYAGWFDQRQPSEVRFAWPGTHIRVEFTGTSLYARLIDTPIEDDTRETDWITVVIDDDKPKTFALAEGLHVYPLATGLRSGTHKALLWKRTEAEVGVISLAGFTLDRGASLGKIDAPKHRIVFVGDSITAGYGNEGPDANCHWSARRENNYRSYGAIAARALHAEYVAMAWSGKGLVRNYEARDTVPMPAVYDRIIPTEEDSPRLPKLHADVVVVNLGTNDFFLGMPDEAQLMGAFRTLLGALRLRYPKAYFIVGLGPMLADDYPQPQSRTTMRAWLTHLIQQIKAGGDERIELIELWIDPKEGMGCDSHPNLASHERLGHELAKLIEQRLDW